MSGKGKLFVVATPIGNLQDFTFRAVETLKNVHCVFAEDTRTSKKLTNHYDIDTKLYSYHDHSSDKEIARVLDILNDNKALEVKSIDLKEGDLLLITGSLYGAAEVLSFN